MQLFSGGNELVESHIWFSCQIKEKNLNEFCDIHVIM